VKTIIRITPIAVTKILSLAMIAIIAMDLIRLYFKKNHEELTELNRMLESVFMLTGEHNVPTLFSSFVLFFSAILLLCIYRTTPVSTHRKYWLSLGMVFMFLSLDESLRIHEGLSRLIRANYEVEGSIRYGTWSLPYLILTAFLGVFFIRFLFQLPQVTKILFILSGSIYVLGAGGFELIEGFLFFRTGEESLLYRLVHWSQEILEMAGIVLFIYGLLDYLANGQASVAFAKNQDSSAPA
jgi:hypothetical protein